MRLDADFRGCERVAEARPRPCPFSPGYCEGLSRRRERPSVVTRLPTGGAICTPWS
jgi:hypothetical protein